MVAVFIVWCQPRQAVIPTRMSQPGTHVVFCPVSLKSHLKILLKLCLNLLELNPTWTATLVYSRYMAEAVKADLQDRTSTATCDRIQHETIEDGLDPSASAGAERIAFKDGSKAALRNILGSELRPTPVAFISDVRHAPGKGKHTSAEMSTCR